MSKLTERNKRNPPKRYSTENDKPKRRKYSEALTDHTNSIIKYAKDSANIENEMRKKK